MEVKIAVVGLGRMGKRHVHTLLYRVPRARVVAVCTMEAHEIEWAKGNADTDVHAIQSLKAIDKGLHVIHQKPLNSELAEAQTVVDAARNNPHLRAMAGFSRCFDASYRDAAEKIHNGAVGKPFVVRSNTCDLLDGTGFFVGYAARNGGIFHHPELAENNDHNTVGVVEFWGGKIAYFYCSRTQAHGYDNNAVLADKLGMRNEVQPDYWQRFEDAFAPEAKEFTGSVLNNTEVPLPLETGMIVMKIGQALQHALLTREVVHFTKDGDRLN
ncbi:hypothetical protein BDW59DRAFT_174167 [Aspergillus cavernicola]|uniref:Gfo/Idh/MocA-like oxidoreductase N-terminal domain-containing protein n=1 Tax=Aspergillus cavernicola TaxID=176166 RepID=A0ABR4I1D9_9EURO